MIHFFFLLWSLERLLGGEVCWVVVVTRAFALFVKCS